MTNDPSFEIRRAPSGDNAIPLSTPGNVLTIQADGTSVAGEPVPGGGSVTPIALVYNVDSSGTAATPNGAFSGDLAFNGSTAVQDAVTAASAFSDAVVAVSNCTVEDLVLTGDIILSLRSYQSQRVDGQNLSTTPFPKLGNVTVDMGAAPTGGPRIEFEGFTFASLSFQGAGAYAAKVTQCFVSGGLIGTIAQQPALYGSTVVDDVTIGQLDLYESQIVGSTTLTTDGLSIWRNSIVGVCTVSALDAFNCTIGGLLGGSTTPGACKFRQCKINAGITSSCSLDAESELFAMKNGAHFDDTIFALSLGQGGDASPITATQSFDFSGVTRGFICATVLAGNIVVTLNETSGADLDGFYIDCYNTTAHTVTVHDSAAATLKVLPTQADGTGTRYFFGISATTHKVVYLSSKKL